MFDRIKVAYYRYVAKKLRERGKERWKAYNSTAKKKLTWYGPSSWLSKEDAQKYVNAQTRIYQLTGPTLGLDVTGTGFNPREKGASAALDEVNAEYKDVVPTYYGEDGYPRPRNFINDSNSK